MVNALFEFGREGFLDGSLDWDTQAFKAALLDLNFAEVGVRQISSSTNATPIVVTTSVAHGYTTGDTVYIADHAGNLAGNGLWVIAAASGSVFSLTRYADGVNSVGSGVGTATGYAVNLGRGTVGTRFWDAFDGCLVTNGLSVNLTAPTVTAGVADANDVTFTSVTGATVEAVAVFQDTGTPTTSRMAALITGKHLVRCSKQAAAAATSIDVEKLIAPIPNSTVLTFSNGASATLSALANAGDRTLTVTSLAAIITAESTALAPATGSGLPVTPNGGNIVVAWQSAPSMIFKL